LRFLVKLICYIFNFMQGMFIQSYGTSLDVPGLYTKQVNIRDRLFFIVRFDYNKKMALLIGISNIIYKCQQYNYLCKIIRYVLLCCSFHIVAPEMC